MTSWRSGTSQVDRHFTTRYLPASRIMCVNCLHHLCYACFIAVVLLLFTNTEGDVNFSHSKVNFRN